MANLPTGGDCFVANAKHVLDRDRTKTLCHSYVTPVMGPLRNVKHEHAWLEKGDTVYDFSNNRELEVPKDVFYILGQIDKKKVKRYSYNDVIRNIKEHKHWGPWETLSEQLHEIGDARGKILPLRLIYTDYFAPTGHLIHAEQKYLINCYGVEIMFTIGFSSESTVALKPIENVLILEFTWADDTYDERDDETNMNHLYSVMATIVHAAKAFMNEIKKSKYKAEADFLVFRASSPTSDKKLHQKRALYTKYIKSHFNVKSNVTVHGIDVFTLR